MVLGQTAEENFTPMLQLLRQKSLVVRRTVQEGSRKSRIDVERAERKEEIEKIGPEKEIEKAEGRRKNDDRRRKFAAPHSGARLFVESSHQGMGIAKFTGKIFLTYYLAN